MGGTLLRKNVLIVLLRSSIPRGFFPFDVGGFVAMEAAVARISYRSEGAGAIERGTLILQFLC